MSEKLHTLGGSGTIPRDLPSPPPRIRSSLSWGQVVVQYVVTALLAGVGLAISLALLLASVLELPVNVMASSALLLVFGYVIYMGTHNAYSWVELEGDILRAKHLYTRLVFERRIEDVEDLLTRRTWMAVLTVQSSAARMTDGWLGRVGGIDIRFRDRRNPVRVQRTDPAMRNARELIEAVVYRMSEHGEIDAEAVDFNGAPLIRRIHWKEKPS